LNQNNNVISEILKELPKFSAFIALAIGILIIIYFEKKRQKNIQKFCNNNGFQYINKKSFTDFNNFKTSFYRSKLVFQGSIKGKSIKFLECYKLSSNRRSSPVYYVILLDNLEKKLPKFSIDYNPWGIKKVVKFLGVKCANFDLHPIFDSKYQVLTDGNPNTLAFFEKIIPYFEQNLPRFSIDSSGDSLMIFSYMNTETALYKEGVKENIEKLVRLIFDSWKSESIKVSNNVSSNFNSLDTKNKKNILSETNTENTYDQSKRFKTIPEKLKKYGKIIAILSTIATIIIIIFAISFARSSLKI